MCLVKSILNLCNYLQEHMPYFRKRMVYEIVTKQLLQWDTITRRENRSSCKIQSGKIFQKKKIFQNTSCLTVFLCEKKIWTLPPPEKRRKSFKNTFQHKIWIQWEDLDWKKWVTSETEEIYPLPESRFLLCWPFWNETSCMVTSWGEYFLFWWPFWNNTSWFGE